MSQYNYSTVLINADNAEAYNIDSDIYKENLHKTIEYGGFREFTQNFHKMLEIAQGEGFSNILITGSSATCREVLVSNMEETLNLLRRIGTSPYNYPAFYVKLAYEWGSQLHSKHPIIPKLEKFRKIFFSSGFRRNWGILISGSNVCLVRRFTEFESRPTILYTISLLLWIFRNSDMLENILEHFEGTSHTSLQPLWDYLSVQFLLHPSWGNDSNGTFNLALFCYSLTQDTHFLYGNNGPHNAAYRVPFQTVMSFVRDIYMKTFPDTETLPPTYLKYSHPFYTHINQLIRLYRMENPVKELEKTASAVKKLGESMQTTSNLFNSLTEEVEREVETFIEDWDEED